MNGKYNKIIPLAIIIVIICYFGYRILNTKILPFQTVTLNCKMEGSQNFPTGELPPKSIPIIEFPYKLSIELNFFTGRFINTRGYLKEILSIYFPIIFVLIKVVLSILKR